jgi:hypothetical protein
MCSKSLPDLVLKAACMLVLDKRALATFSPRCQIWSNNVQYETMEAIWCNHLGLVSPECGEFTTRPFVRMRWPELLHKGCKASIRQCSGIVERFQLLGCGRIIILFVRRAEFRDMTTLCDVVGAHIKESRYMIIASHHISSTRHGPGMVDHPSRRLSPEMGERLVSKLGFSVHHESCPQTNNGLQFFLCVSASACTRKSCCME